MEPTLRSGELLLIDRDEASRGGEGVFVVRVDNDLMVKRIKRAPGVIYVVSDNPTGGSFEIRKEEVRDFDIVGRVIWAGRRL